ncbi:zinc finger HIT domain-containing protein 3 isoform X1 [Centruroides vittatus]|uniref:zinc finger HIT domain-containing protein 3 isoform X1 n=1 Tax=Centruroides vittatus TaxID=120091 RepID=UPI00351047E9
MAISKLKKMADVCEVCGNVTWKYKVPCCLIKYCSVTCYKKHKETGCSKQNTEQKLCSQDEVQCLDKNADDDDAEYQFITEDTVLKEKLKLLSQDSTLKSVLYNPHLRDMLQNLAASSHPSKDLEEAMKIPIFVEFVEHCMRIVEPNNSNVEK